MLIDSHVNLHSDKYKDDLSDVIENARNAGVRAMLTISDQLASTEAIKKITDAHDFIWRSVGVHPHYASDAGGLQAAELIALAQDKRVVGIGESGLDFYYEYSDRDLQFQIFKEHIKAAQLTDLPLIIHTRDADDEMQSILETTHRDKAFTPLLHCYTGGPALAKSALALGGYVAFSGIITFKNADEVRQVVELTPLDRIIVETDCPYLAPVPKRGRRNEPAYLTHVVEKLAEIKGISVEDAASKTTENFFRLFSKVNFNEHTG